jgi:hypothetical protein
MKPNHTLDEKRGTGRSILEVPRAVFILCLAALLAVFAVTGCKKAEASSSAAAHKGPVDLVKLRKAFPPPLTADVQRHLQLISEDIRYGILDRAQNELDGLAGDTSLTETQKQAVNDAIAQLKQAQAAAPAQPAPSQ